MQPAGHVCCSEMHTTGTGQTPASVPSGTHNTAHPSATTPASPGDVPPPHPIIANASTAGIWRGRTTEAYRIARPRGRSIVGGTIRRRGPTLANAGSAHAAIGDRGGPLHVVAAGIS